MTGSIVSQVNRALMLASRRAENPDDIALSDTFVPIDALAAILQSQEHHVLFGRRGTGKTHMLRYLAATKRTEGDAAVYVDLRTIGSSGGVYGDSDLSVASRATTLLVDVIAAIHAAIYELVLTLEPFADQLHRIGPALDRLGDAVTEVEVKGTVEVDLATSESSETSRSSDLGGRIGSKGAGMSATRGSRASARKEASSRVVRSGVEQYHIVFGELTGALRQLVDALPGRLWILLDEWSSLPLELQPFLADLLRRNAFTVPGITVKIGAIERRSRFIQVGAAGDYLGIELGSDTSATQDIDDYLAFDHGREQVSSFFAELLHRHAAYYLEAEGGPGGPPSARDFIDLAFADQTAFSRLVLASEGVPRDALQIAAVSAGLASGAAIKDRDVLQAERDYFRRDKEGRISDSAAQALGEIVDTCVNTDTRMIALKRPSESFAEVVQELYDARLLHRRAQNTSLPGSAFSEKFDVFLVDFGCFVELVQAGKIRTVDDGGRTVGIVRTARRGTDAPQLGPARVPSAATWRR